MQRGDALQVQTVQSQPEFYHYNVLFGARCITNQHSLRLRQKVVPQQNVDVSTQIVNKNGQATFSFEKQINMIFRMAHNFHVYDLHNIQ